jgi:hypothetical protein
MILSLNALQFFSFGNTSRACSLGTLSKVFWCTFNLNIGRWDEICCFHGITVLADSARRDHWNFVAGYLCSLGEHGICMSPGVMAVVQGFTGFDGVSLKDVETRHTPFIYVVFTCTEK